MECLSRHWTQPADYCSGIFLILIPLADAVWVSYVFQLLLVPGYAHQCMLAGAAMSRLHLDSFSIMLFVALWAINKLIAAESAFDKLDLEEKKAARKLAREFTGTPWLVPVHCMVPSASLIAILLVIGGVEVNPGPVTSIVFTLLMLVTMSGGKRSWSEAEGTLFGPGKPVFCASTYHDMSTLLPGPAKIDNDPVAVLMSQPLSRQTHSK